MDAALPDNLPEILDILEKLSFSMMAKAAPIRFGVAQSSADKAAAFRLRCQALIARGSATTADFPDGMEHDEYDERALQVVGWDEGSVVVATGRIVLPQAGRLLPTEAAFGLALEPRGEVVDIGRYTVAHHLAVRENRYFPAILGACWLEACSRGYLRVCGTASRGMLRHYRRLGFLVTELAPPHVYYGEERFPCWYDVLGSARGLLKLWGSGS
ncbi:MAG: GNAT family N-acetyltransferase [Anaerolineae bacterium]|nr:GNAT family N-acetyltransferase [Anaerolineae bacterium]